MYYITVNRHVIKANKDHGKADPPFSIRKGKSGKPFYAAAVGLPKGAKLVYSPDRPLKCGAAVFLTADEVEYDQAYPAP